MNETKVAAILFVFTGMVFFATAAVSGEPVFVGLGVTFVALGIHCLNEKEKKEPHSKKKEDDEAIVETDNKIKARSVTAAVVLTPAVVVAIVAAMISFCSLVTSVYNNHYQTFGAKSSMRLTCAYNKSKPNYASGTFKPSKGKLEFGYCQKKGNKKCRYSFFCKKNTQSKYKVVRKYYNAPKNNTYYGTYNICKGNGRTVYDFKNTKVAGTGKASILYIDLALK